MAVDAAHEPIVEDIVNLFTCMVVLIGDYLVELLVLTGGDSKIVPLIIVVD